MNYEIDINYLFPVVPSEPGDDSFTLLVDTDNGKKTVSLSKLAFQKDENYIQPTELYCRVKSIDENGLPVLSHIVAPYVYQLYAKTFALGETFECEVISVPSKPEEEPFMIRDRNGIFFRHDEPEGLLSKGQIIRCKFTKLTQRFFQIERVDEGAKMPYFSYKKVFNDLGVSKHYQRFIINLMLHSKTMEPIVEEIRQKNPLWLLTASRMVIARLPEWFLQIDIKHHSTSIRNLLNILRDGLLYHLEGSGFLNSVPAEHRRNLREQFTTVVESLEPYDETLALIAERSEDTFVKRLLDKLRKSGYLYHPARQFAVLMIIFRLHPDKVGYYLNRIFESIFGRDLENWKREPFRSAFVEQFEIYVNQARREFDALPIAETREQKTRLETIIIAIALQLILADKEADLSRSSSLFYRYIALLRPLNSEILLSRSFLALMSEDEAPRLNYAQLKEPMMMMTQATVMNSTNFMSRLNASHRYSNGLVDITVSASGIRLSLNRRNDITERVIPEGLMPWLSPQILLNGIHGLTANRIRKIPEHNQWWHEIENNLFETKTHITQNDEELVERSTRRAEIGDYVYIVIVGIDDYLSNNPTFKCRISDKDFLEGTGILKRDQIVGYNLKQPSEHAFSSSDGSRLGYYAQVLDMRADGTYIFSLRDETDRFIDEHFEYGDSYVAIIAGINEHDYSAILRDGIGLFLEKSPDHVNPDTGELKYQVGDVVYCRLQQKGKQGQLRAYITEKSEREADKFTKTDAFFHLMQSLGESENNDDGNIDEEELMRDFDEILSIVDVRELIEIIRFKAIAETDLIKAYDYLRFARLLALVIGDEALADKLITHAGLLSLHQYYATNSRIDEDKLQALETQSLTDPLLKMIYHRLEMVSWLGRDDRISELYKTVTHPSNELEGSIARMVLSYNMLNSSENIAGNNIASEIKQQIMKKLNVNNETRQSKYYGSESKYLEFKTSIVYTANAPGEKLREHPEEQQFHIMSRIAGLLNANGGRLYLGVNNDGYEVGLHDDFKYYEYRFASDGQHTFKIKDIDNMCVFIENLIAMNFDKAACRKISVQVDEEAKKGVIYIDVQESLEPVFLQGHLFVRQSGQSTYEYFGNDITDFEKERADLRAERAHLLEASTTGQSSSEQNEVSVIDNEEVATAEIVATDESSVEIAEGERIATSRWRPNVLHDYEAGFADPLGYLYFMGDKEIQFSTVDLYLESDPNCRLALVIPHDMAEAFLVLGYENERVLRISLQEVIEKEENMPFGFNDEYKLLFASIATKDDILVCIGVDNSDALWKRAQKLSQLDVSHLTSTPKRLHDTAINHTFGYEIADSSMAERFDDCIAGKLNRRFGVTMRVKKESPDLQYKLGLLIKDCQPGNI